jgi:carbonic anhydrase
MKSPKTINSELLRKVSQARVTDEEIFGRRQPVYFWVSCSDYPMAPNEATGMPASDFIIHDNIANLIAPADSNCLAALQFAVDALQLKTIVICGHYECSGIKLANDGCRLPILGNWLAPIARTKRKFENLLDRIGESEQINALCELNVIEQVFNICRTTVVEKAWERNQDLSVCGLIYNSQNGLLTNLSAFTNSPALFSNSYATAISNFKSRWRL